MEFNNSIYTEPKPSPNYYFYVFLIPMNRLKLIHFHLFQQKQSSYR